MLAEPPAQVLRRRHDVLHQCACLLCARHDFWQCEYTLICTFESQRHIPQSLPGDLD
jgi:hypothetical protein